MPSTQNFKYFKLKLFFKKTQFEQETTQSSFKTCLCHTPCKTSRVYYGHDLNHHFNSKIPVKPSSDMKLIGTNHISTKFWGMNRVCLMEQLVKWPSPFQHSLYPCLTFQSFPKQFCTIVSHLRLQSILSLLSNHSTPPTYSVNPLRALSSSSAENHGESMKVMEEYANVNQ